MHDFRSSLSSLKINIPENVKKKIIKDPIYLKLSIFLVRADDIFYSFIIFVPNVVHHTVTTLLIIFIYSLMQMSKYGLQHTKQQAIKGPKTDRVKQSNRKTINILMFIKTRNETHL